jgi:hypothetical protein
MLTEYNKGINPLAITATRRHAPLSNAKRDNRAGAYPVGDFILVERVIMPCNRRAVGTLHTMAIVIGFVPNGTKTEIGDTFSLPRCCA